MWNSGSTEQRPLFARHSTGGSSFVVSMYWLVAAVRLAWVRIAPLGKPVVPPVYCSTAIASRGSPIGCGRYAPPLASRLRNGTRPSCATASVSPSSA